MIPREWYKRLHPGSIIAGRQACAHNMLRPAAGPLSLPKRWIYVASRKQISRTESHKNNRPSRDTRDTKELEIKQRQLEEKIRNITAYQQTLRGYISFKEDKEAREYAAKRQGIQDLDILHSDEDIAEFDNLLRAGDSQKSGLFANPASSVDLPPTLLDKIGNAIINVSSNDKGEQNWPAIVDKIEEHGGFSKGQVKEVDMLLYNIPVVQRPVVLSKIQTMMNEATIEPNGLTYGLISSAYGQTGNTQAIYDVIRDMKSKGFEPNVHIYGNLLKSLSKENNMDESATVVDVMRRQEVAFSTQTYTILMQASLKQRNHRQVAEIFDMMKFISDETRPDLKAYCTMILSAAQQYQIERVLDLYKEISAPQNAHILENSDRADIQNLYNVLIYSCSRDPRTHLKAWEFLLKLKDQGLAIDRRSMESLMYLCGKTGEVMLSRAMFKQLCQNAVSYPTSMTLSSLFSAYSNFTPTQTFSKVLSSPLATQIQMNFAFDDVLTSEEVKPSSPPFLPVPFLTDKVHVVAESRAIMTFFSENLPNLINEKVVLAYLNIPVILGNMSELKYRWNSHTFLPPAVEDQEADVLEDAKPEVYEVSNDLSPSFKVARNHYMYNLAMEACINSEDAEFGMELWADRGKWRQSSVFKNMSKPERDQSDFLFARKTVNLLGVCGEFEDAVKVLQSTINQFNWKPWHIEVFINKLTGLDDQSTLSIVRRLLGHRFRATRQHQEYYDYEDAKRLDTLKSVNKAY